MGVLIHGQDGVFDQFQAGLIDQIEAGLLVKLIFCIGLELCLRMMMHFSVRLFIL